jgi:hypothetical protein
MSNLDQPAAFDQAPSAMDKAPVFRLQAERGRGNPLSFGTHEMDARAPGHRQRRTALTAGIIARLRATAPNSVADSTTASDITGMTIIWKCRHRRKATHVRVRLRIVTRLQ